MTAHEPLAYDEQFFKEAEDVEFSQAKEVCALNEHITALKYDQLVWDLRKWERFGMALRQCERLQTLSIWGRVFRGMLNGEQAEAMFKALGEGSLPALTKLDLFCNNGFGDAGCVALAAAVGGGALPVLQELNLSGYPNGCGVTGATFEALEKGALPSLLKLDLSYNEHFGNAGCAALAAAVARGALPRLEEVRLFKCPVRGAGRSAVHVAQDHALVYPVRLDELRRWVREGGAYEELEALAKGLKTKEEERRRREEEGVYEDQSDEEP
eukprot:2158220-Rhodomonas_salina.1